MAKPNLSSLKTFAPLTPYLAVLLGLYGLNSGWLSILLYHLGIILILRAAGYWHLGHKLKTGPERLILVVLVLVSAAAGFLIYALWSLIKLETLLLPAELAKLGLAGAPWTLFMIYYFTLNPILEEVFWRGYLGDKSIWPVWNDLWFAGYHILVLLRFVQLPWVILSFLILVGAAWLWRQVTRKYDNLLFPLASHAAADATIIGAIFFLAQQSL